ncbi:hypothetical protein [Curtobacterium sp. RRHDQ10]|uniref:hypothetical protein n=1 Tax=Curtobacterium phyllosphaerae TaxID=3413379 RepID=UPI003BEF586E
MFRRSLSLTAIVLVAGTALTGCAVHDSTGRITVALSTDAAADHHYLVEVFDAQHQMVEHQSMLGGQTADFAGVPLGAVTVRAKGLCAVHSTVSYDAVAHVRLATTGC